ncbi:hypothetical protein G5B38_21650 (plasmid) [Pseudohalocynthiibacter aestuariivivens]|nr:DUF6088 family protein [Pseudohalocynthiibacter aestuariivivens]QIE48212.1 hypothetical protein G5B38_21650 [Pseudohalocynthiibacter aestuariivivens]
MITSKIKQRIIGKGRGAIFAPSDFLDIGSRASVDQALSRLADHGVIRRLTRGLYDYPKKSPRFGYVSPSADDVAQAVARKDNQVLQPSPAMAANQLGLSTQVPSKPTYMTDGPTRVKTIGQQVIQFRNASSKTLVGAGQKTGAVFQALRYVGKDRVDDQVIGKLARALDDKDRTLLSKQSKHVPAWMHPVVQQIVAHA